MANIRGVSLISGVKYISDNFGEGGLVKVVDSLEPQDRDILRSKLHPMNWYPVKTYSAFMAAADKIFGKGDYNLCFNIGKYSAEDIFSGLYKVFLELGNPHFVIRRGHIAWRTIIDSGELEIEQTGDKFVKVRITGFEEPDKAFCWKVSGYFGKVLEMSGAKNVRVNEGKCACDGGPYCEYDIQWE
ncbi:MAG: DUF2378 family protein [Candidatus Omnitrophota bacterium]